MNNREIVIKALQKAMLKCKRKEDNDDCLEIISMHELLAMSSISNNIFLRGIITDQIFAKRYFGKNWKLHLQQMIVANDPFAYIKRRLGKSILGRKI